METVCFIESLKNESKGRYTLKKMKLEFYLLALFFSANGKKVLEKSVKRKTYYTEDGTWNFTYQHFTRDSIVPMIKMRL